MKSPSSSTTVGSSSASVFFQVTGNVYPQGHYYVTMYIGNPPKPYFLDIDTGSDLTWVQCEAPCQNCLPVILHLLSHSCIVMFTSPTEISKVSTQLIEQGCARTHLAQLGSNV
ncbi:putative nepenthesin [Helianthus anomalus]